MPEPPIPTPTRERPVSRNLFVEADPDLDTSRSRGRTSRRGAMAGVGAVAAS